MNIISNIKSLKFYPLLMLSLFLVSCQEEEYEVINEEEVQSLSRDSESFDLIMRTSMHDGSLDDGLDNSPCFSLDFPYEVLVNGKRHFINTESDLSEFLNNRGAGNIPGNPELQFPVSVTNANYQQIPVNNAQQFRALQQRCETEVALGEQPVICAKIQFPVTVFLYDRQLQQTLSERVTNNENLFRFLSNIGNTQVFNFSFPLQVEVNGTLINIGNNRELRNVLRGCTE